MVEVTERTRIKAARLADKLKEASDFTAYVTAEDILLICRDVRELNFYYYKIYEGL